MKVLQCDLCRASIDKYKSNKSGLVLVPIINGIEYNIAVKFSITNTCHGLFDDMDICATCLQTLGDSIATAMHAIIKGDEVDPADAV
jgi:hypothetical protein